MKTGKTVGSYCIPIFLLKIPSEHIAIPLCNIINDSFSKGCFPDMMKSAKVINLYKKNSPEVAFNCKPISLLSVFSKIVEKLIHSRLYNFFDNYNVLNSLQFGLRNRPSTLHALINLTESMKKTIDDGVYGHGCDLFIDLQKAFDTKKLKHYGVRGTALSWFSFYLSDRKQYVSVNGHTPDHLKILYSVPQGSVLGPLLLLIYINNLSDLSKLVSFYLFADDINIYFKSHDLVYLQK